MTNTNNSNDIFFSFLYFTRTYNALKEVLKHIGLEGHWKDIFWGEMVIWYSNNDTVEVFMRFCTCYTIYLANKQSTKRHFNVLQPTRDNRKQVCVGVAPVYLYTFVTSCYKCISQQPILELEIKYCLINLTLIWIANFFSIYYWPPIIHLKCVKWIYVNAKVLRTFGNYYWYQQILLYAFYKTLLFVIFFFSNLQNENNFGVLKKLISIFSLPVEWFFVFTLSGCHVILIAYKPIFCQFG